MLPKIVAYAIVVVGVRVGDGAAARRLHGPLVFPVFRPDTSRPGRPPGYHDRLKAIRALYAAWTHEEATSLGRCRSGRRRESRCSAVGTRLAMLRLYITA